MERVATSTPSIPFGDQIFVSPMQRSGKVVPRSGLTILECRRREHFLTRLNHRRCQVELVCAGIRCVFKTEEFSCIQMPLINFRDLSVTLDELCLHSSIDTLDRRATGYQTTHLGWAVMSPVFVSSPTTTNNNTTANNKRGQQHFGALFDVLAPSERRSATHIDLPPLSH